MVPLVRTDENGHGSHVTSIILNTDQNAEMVYQGIAPNAKLVSVKAFGADGGGSYLDVIRGIDWVVANKDTYNIRVLNLSLQRDAAVVLLGRSAEPGGDARLAGRDRRGRGRGQHRPRSDDDRRAGQRALRDHRGRDVGQLHARR